jgi:hypothetical protein
MQREARGVQNLSLAFFQGSDHDVSFRVIENFILRPPEQKSLIDNHLSHFPTLGDTTRIVFYRGALLFVYYSAWVCASNQW